MDQVLRGLSQVQQNDCRKALQRFIDRHELSDWEIAVKVQETEPGKFSVKVEIALPPDSGLPEWPVEEFDIADESFSIAAEVDRLLEAGYQARSTESETP